MALTVSATDTEAQKPVNVIYQQLLLENARPVAPYFAGTQSGIVTERAGSATIKWRRFNTSADLSTAIAPSTTALAELTGVASYMQGRNADTVSFTDVVATVSKFGQFFILNEEVDVFLPNGTMAGISETLGITSGRVANQLQRNVAEDNLTQRFAGNVASKGLVNSIIAVGLLDRVLNELDTNSAMPFMPMTSGSTNIGTVPILPAYWAICHPHVAHDVSKLVGFTSIEKYVGQVATLPGEFGHYGLAGGGARFIKTPEATIDADAGATGGTDVRSTGASLADVYQIVVYGRACLGSVGLGTSHTDGIYRAGDDQAAIQLIAKSRQSGGSSDPFEEIMTMAFKLWHAGAVLNSNWGRAINVSATDLSN